MKKNLKIVGLMLIFFLLILGTNVLAAKVDSETKVGLAPITIIEYQTGNKEEISPIVDNKGEILPIINANNDNLSYQSNINQNQAFSSLVLAENVKAGTFGANAGGGNFSFPGNLTLGALNPGMDVVLSFNYRDGYPYIISAHDYLGFMTAPKYYFDNEVAVKKQISILGQDGEEALTIKANNVSNLFIGSGAGGDIAGGTNNIFIGEQTGNRNTVGSFNVSLGREAMHSNTTGNWNTAVGYDALYASETGKANTAIGFESLQNARGQQNTAIGYRTGYNNSFGSGNVFIGYQAGLSETGSDKLYIANNGTNSLIYGDFAAGKVGINTTNPDATLRVNGSVKANYFIAYNGQYGVTKTVKVKGNNNQNCNLNFTNGLLTSTSCPTNDNNSGSNSTD